MEAKFHLKHASCLLIQVHSFLKVYRLYQSGNKKHFLWIQEEKSAFCGPELTLQCIFFISLYQYVP